MERIYGLFSKLLLYPELDTRDTLAELREAAAACPQVLTCLDRFAQALSATTFEAWEELYTRTFDVTAQCPLYVGVHLFGCDNPKRPMLMAGLCEAYSRAGVTTAVELPDHLSVILANHAAFDGEAWDELSELCLIPAVAKMIKELECSDNPYRYVLMALDRVLEAKQGVAAHV